MRMSLDSVLLSAVACECTALAAVCCRHNGLLSLGADAAALHLAPSIRGAVTTWLCMSASDLQPICTKHCY